MVGMFGGVGTGAENAVRRRELRRMKERIFHRRDCAVYVFAVRAEAAEDELGQKGKRAVL